jgi:hypothetical protein
MSAPAPAPAPDSWLFASLASLARASGEVLGHRLYRGVAFRENELQSKAHVEDRNRNREREREREREKTQSHTQRAESCRPFDTPPRPA